MSASAEATGSAGSGSAGSGSAGSGSAGSGSAGSAAGSGSGAGSAVSLKRGGLTTGFEAESRNTATIIVTTKGEHVVNGSPVKDADLGTVLRALFARNPKLEVSIVLEPGVPQDKSVHVLDVVKAVGITKVALKVTPPSTP